MSLNTKFSDTIHLMHTDSLRIGVPYSRLFLNQTFSHMRVKINFKVFIFEVGIFRTFEVYTLICMK